MNETLSQQILHSKGEYLDFDFLPQHKRKERRKRDIEVCTTNLLDVRDILHKYDMQFFLMYGTLLGAIRGDGFIEHDTDTDLGLFEESKEKFIKVVMELRDKGFSLIRTACNDNVISLMRDMEYIDFIFFKHENLPFSNFIEYDFMGVPFWIPDNTEELLTVWYGDWANPEENRHAQILYGI